MKYLLPLLFLATSALAQTTLITPKVNSTTGALVGVPIATFRTGNSIQQASAKLDAFVTNATWTGANLALAGNLDATGITIGGVAISGTGTVTATGGSLTLNGVILGAGGVDIKRVAGIATDGTSVIILGVPGSSVGGIQLGNATSGTITIQPVTGALGTTTLSAPAGTGTLLTNNSTATITNKTIDFASNTIQNRTTVWEYAISDESTDITTGTAKLTVRAPHAATVTGVRLSLNTASSSGLPTVDINEAGTTILSTKLTCDASEKTSTTAATAAVISDTSIADDAELTFDIDVAGTGAKGAKVKIYVSF